MASDSGSKLPDSTRIRVALAGGGALEVITAVGLEHRLGLVAQAGLGAFLVFATVGLWVWLTLMVNAPLTHVAGLEVGVDIHAATAVGAGDRRSCSGSSGRSTTCSCDCSVCSRTAR